MSSILVVEDDRMIQELVGHLLRDEGYTVALTSDGASALRMAQTAPPDLILMDLMLPRMDGLAAIAALNDDPTTRGIPIIAMSAGSNLYQARDALRVDTVLSKPFEVEVLLTNVELCLRRGRTMRQQD